MSHFAESNGAASAHSSIIFLQNNGKAPCPEPVGHEACDTILQQM